VNPIHLVVNKNNNKVCLKSSLYSLSDIRSITISDFECRYKAM